MEPNGEILKLLEYTDDELEAKVEEISQQLATLLKDDIERYFYLDAVSKGNAGHIGFCTYRN